MKHFLKVSQLKLKFGVNLRYKSRKHTLGNIKEAIALQGALKFNGDTISLDFEGFVDGVAFEGGKGENYPLEIGSHSFIDNFEEKLIGKTMGEEFDIDDEDEKKHFEDYKNLVKSLDSHYDTPLTIPHEIDILKSVGFPNIQHYKEDNFNILIAKK